jgi:hypothetical protein
MSATIGGYCAHVEERETAARAMARSAFVRLRLPALVSALLVALLCTRELTRAGVLFGVDQYDDGVYVGAGVRLAQGFVPYRDFAFAHPPGIIELLAPLAVAARWTGTKWCLAEARVLTTLCCIGNAFLLAYVTRHRGAASSLAAGLTLAAFPLAVAADKTVMLEPYVVFFVLLGVALLFDGDHVRPQWAVAGGASFGLALSMKLWALLPLAAALLACASARRSVARFTAGAAGAVAAAAVPFFLLAPRAFLRDVFAGQLGRGSFASPGATPAWTRLTAITGVDASSQHQHVALAVAVGVAWLAIAVAGIAFGQRATPLDWFSLAAAALVVVAMFAVRDFFTHYAYFAVAFIALAVATSLSRALAGVRRRTGLRPDGAVVVAVCVAAAFGVAAEAHFIRENPGALNWGDPGPSIAAAIPAIPGGGCVVTDQPSYTLAANRFGSCPAAVDPYYEWLLASPDHTIDSAKPPPALRRQWQRRIETADFLVLTPHESLIPLTSRLAALVRKDFVQVSSVGADVYERRR